MTTDITSQPWFVGAWRRRSITVPGSAPTEPCEAWWIQTERSFVDIRFTLPGLANNGLPYSSTRAFAGTFTIIGDETRWNLELDTARPTPHTDIGAASGLYISPEDPNLMIEDAPGRFVEEWERVAPTANSAINRAINGAIDLADQPIIEVVHGHACIAVRIGEICAVVLADDQQTNARLWLPGRQRGLRASKHGDRRVVTFLSEEPETKVQTLSDRIVSIDTQAHRWMSVQ